jgi:predicted ATPase
MIKSIHFKNFRALQHTTLRLGPFTLIVGPNGSGKSTAMEAIRFAFDPTLYRFDTIMTAGGGSTGEPDVEVSLEWSWEGGKTTTVTGLESKRAFGPVPQGQGTFTNSMEKALADFRVFSFDAKALATPVQAHSKAQLGEDGSDLAAVLNTLSGTEPERFAAFNDELQRWLPEFDRVVFDYPGNGLTEFLLRTRVGQHKYRAFDLSHGTLFALAFLTLAYLPSPPAIVCFEEPDRGIHPRLLREIRDGMYRLAYPESFGEKRQPVQVIATTHSPYLLNLYKEHPEEIVIAHKDEGGGHFDRLSEKSYITEILEAGDAPLGEIWFSGILGGVPSAP